MSRAPLLRPALDRRWVGAGAPPTALLARVADAPRAVVAEELR